MKNPKTIAAMVGLFLSSFLFFIYLSFPYVVLKEAIASKVLLATGINLRMESLSPALPLGLKAKGVELYKGQSSKFKMAQLSVKLSILQMFMARLGVSVDVEDLKGGELGVGVGFSLIDVVTGNIDLPSAFDLSANGFMLDELSAFAIGAAVDSGVGGAIAGPLLGKLGVKGKLFGNVDLSLNSKQPSQSSGEVKISIANGVLVLSDPSLKFPDQAFKTAQISAKLNSGTLSIDPTTRFTASDIELGIDGKVALRPQMSNSDLSLKAFVKLQGLLAEQYGVLVDSLSNGLGKNGSFNLQIGGTLAAPEVNPI